MIAYPNPVAILFITVIGVVVYARALHHLLQMFKIESVFKKELAYSASLFVPLSVFYLLILVAR